MYDLFNPAPSSALTQNELCHPKIMNDISMIQGLTYIPNFLDKLEVKGFIDAINSELWLSDIKRRVQHYGYKYAYKSRSIDYSMFIGQLPSWSMTMAHRLFDQKYISELPDQLIINE